MHKQIHYYKQYNELKLPLPKAATLPSSPFHVCFILMCVL